MKSINFLLLFILLLTGSSLLADEREVNSEQLREQFHSQLYLDLFSTYKLFITQMANLNSGKPVTGPVLSWQLVAEFNTINNSGVREILCLFYKIPLVQQQKGGHIKLVDADKRGRCWGRFLQPARAELKNIRSLQMTIALPGIRKSRKKIANFHLQLKVSGIYEIAGRALHRPILLPLVNLDTSNIQYQEGKRRIRRLPTLTGGRRYSSWLTERVIPGVMVLPGKMSDLSLDSGTRTVVKPGEICLQINDQCQVVGDVTCDRCQAPSYPVISSKCQTRFGRVCGPNRCGSRGEPACVRGFNYLHQPIESGCSKGSPAGLCQDGLHTFCDGSRLLLVCL
ncbi:MAG: hypothetical protein HN353_06440 [Bdellovibrionales bacterium]|nr:hypothetical protein [Bdellovibrionales bacterium]MBT3526272.1 hypothetical protein [Bdellovibrionales bacterium]MBT7669881.1 hypothetical protein [Bdellovibrionales bacterium]MBT7766822.1 hypothetical protein [Bdellovibrionales bacterium]